MPLLRGNTRSIKGKSPRLRLSWRRLRKSWRRKMRGKLRKLRRRRRRNELKKLGCYRSKRNRGFRKRLRRKESWQKNWLRRLE